MFVNYVIAKDGGLPAYQAGMLYEYVFAGNGVFVRARRPGLDAMILVSPTVIRGLGRVQEYVLVERRVPDRLLAAMALTAYRNLGREVLFYLLAEPWHIVTPDQVMGAGSVRPCDPFNAGMAKALVEVHSHHIMRPFFSATDNADERNGFRLYSVLGSLGGMSPKILTRVGIYGHFRIIPSRMVYEMPAGLVDAAGGGDDDL